MKTFFIFLIASMVFASSYQVRIRHQQIPGSKWIPSINETAIQVLLWQETFEPGIKDGKGNWIRPDNILSSTAPQTVDVPLSIFKDLKRRKKFIRDSFSVTGTPLPTCTPMILPTETPTATPTPDIIN